MNFQTTVMIAFAAIGAANIVFGGVFIFGRWTQRVEMAKLSWDIQQLAKEIDKLSDRIDGRYTALERRQNEDHVLIRGLQTWKTELDVKIEMTAEEHKAAHADIQSDIEMLKQRAGFLTRRATDKDDG